jgi:glycosyltransferase involved in cell wall biosynthesis
LLEEGNQYTAGSFMENSINQDLNPLPKPSISAVICTRNRGSTVIPTVISILANTHSNFEVILVDQSTNQETWQAVQSYCNDPRFRYFHTETIGLGLSRNIGLNLANSNIIAYLDDDVTVSPQWLGSIEEIFITDKKVALVYCQVTHSPFDQAKGYVPVFRIKKDFIIKSMLDLLIHELGIGAGMAVNKTAIEKIKGFDDSLGAGSYFRSAEDRDIAIRLILKGWSIYYSSQISVIHDGFRSFEEGKAHTKGDFFGLGAAYIKPIKCGYWRAIPLFFSIPRIKNWFEPFGKAIQFRKPSGFNKFIYFSLGVLKGLRTPVDPDNILYQVDQPRESSKNMKLHSPNE